MPSVSRVFPQVTVVASGWTFTLAQRDGVTPARRPRDLSVYAHTNPAIGAAASSCIAGMACEQVSRVTEMVHPEALPIALAALRRGQADVDDRWIRAWSKLVVVSSAGVKARGK